VCLTRLKNYKIKTQQKIDPQQQNQTQNIKKYIYKNWKIDLQPQNQKTKKKNQNRVEALNDVERGEWESWERKKMKEIQKIWYLRKYKKK
jgi:hypothetical protein